MIDIISIGVEGHSIPFGGASYPYKAFGVPPEAVGGRSIVPGVDPMPLLAQSFRLGNILMRNMALSGTNFPAMVARTAVHLGSIPPPEPRRTKPRRVSLFSIDIGSNDGCIGPYTSEGSPAGPQHFADDVGSHCLSLRDDYGFGVGSDAPSGILCTVLPRTDGTFSETYRQAYNARLNSAGWAEAHGVIICPFGEHPIMGVLSATLDTSLYVDGIHPSADRGHALLAPTWMASVRKLIEMLQ